MGSSTLVTPRAVARTRFLAVLVTNLIYVIAT